MFELAIFIHERLGTTALFYTAALGVWALWLAVRGAALDGAYFGALVIGELLLVAQIVLGTLAWLGGGLAGRLWLHVLYGLLAALMWPFVYTFSRGRDSEPRQEAILFFATSFFLFLLLLRAIDTAAQPF